MNNVIDLFPRFLSRKELALRYGVSLRTVDRWVEEGCPSEQWGMRIRRFNVRAMDQWLSERKSA